MSATLNETTASSILSDFARKRGLTLDALRQALAFGPCARMGAVNDELFEQIILRANMLGADPFSELRAFNGAEGLVVYMTIDGYLRIANSHPQMDGLEIELPAEEEWVAVGNTTVNGMALKAPKWVAAKVYRKDRRCPITVTEYLDECYAPVSIDATGQVYNNPSWSKAPKRTLTQRAVMSALRTAFGIGAGASLSLDDVNTRAQTAKPAVSAESALESARTLAKVQAHEEKHDASPRIAPASRPSPAKTTSTVELVSREDGEPAEAAEAKAEAQAQAERANGADCSSIQPAAADAGKRGASSSNIELGMTNPEQTAKPAAEAKTDVKAEAPEKPALNSAAKHHIVDTLIERLDQGLISYEKAAEWLKCQAANFAPEELSYALGRLAMKKVPTMGSVNGLGSVPAATSADDIEQEVA